MNKIVFLYTELAEYFLACIKKLAENVNVDIHIIHWKVNKEAPFKFNLPDVVKFYQKENYKLVELKEIIDGVKPNAIYCSGWVDKDYLEICKKYNSYIPVIVGIDNQWRGDIRQKLAVLAAPLKIKPYFNHAWVAGKEQYQFAQKLGFKDNNILTGFYSADVNKFNREFENNLLSKAKFFPQRFIYVGRYYEFKGIIELWKAFTELHLEIPNEWELWCLGTGTIKHFEHYKIKHFGFVQPNEISSFIAQTGVFILPSRFEPWGVVVHEFAAAGFPLLLSNKVGAKSEFLIENENGFLFESENIESIKNAMKKIILASTDQLLLMGEKSNLLAQKITPDIWTKTLLNVIHK